MPHAYLVSKLVMFILPEIHFPSLRDTRTVILNTCKRIVHRTLPLLLLQACRGGTAIRLLLKLLFQLPQLVVNHHAKVLPWCKFFKLVFTSAHRLRFRHKSQLQLAYGCNRQEENMFIVWYFNVCATKFFHHVVVDSK